MRKINFSKVEQTLQEGLRRYSAKQLLYLADLADSFGFVGKDAGPFDDPEIRAISLQTLLRNLQILRKKDLNLYKKLNIDGKEIKSLIDHPHQITEKEWKKIKEIQKRVDQYRNELRNKLGSKSDAEIIKAERKKQKNRRFNVKDQWLPLH